MNNIVGYIDYNNSLNKLEKYLSKLFFKISIYKIDADKYKIFINSDKLNKRNFSKINVLLKKNNIEAIALSDAFFKEKELFEENNFQVLNGKLLMKNLVKEILKYIYKIQNKEMLFDELYITIDDDRNADIIIDLANYFKNINIVTDKIKKVKRLDLKFEKNSDLIYSISNNKKKGLKRASIIVNFDYDEKFFNNFNLNRKAIIINLNDKSLKLKSGYQGTIIENICVSYKDENYNNDFANFNKSILYESKIYKMRYNQIQYALEQDNCNIKYILGKNGAISISELKNNKT